MVRERWIFGFVQTCHHFLCLKENRNISPPPPGVFLSHLSPKLFGDDGSKYQVILGKSCWTDVVHDTSAPSRETCDSGKTTNFSEPQLLHKTWIVRSFGDKTSQSTMWLVQCLARGVEHSKRQPFRERRMVHFQQERLAQLLVLGDIVTAHGSFSTSPRHQPASVCSLAPLALSPGYAPCHWEYRWFRESSFLLLKSSSIRRPPLVRKTGFSTSWRR